MRRYIKPIIVSSVRWKGNVILALFFCRCLLAYECSLPDNPGMSMATGSAATATVQPIMESDDKIVKRIRGRENKNIASAMKLCRKLISIKWDLMKELQKVCPTAFNVTFLQGPPNHECKSGSRVAFATTTGLFTLDGENNHPLACPKRVRLQIIWPELKGNNSDRQFTTQSPTPTRLPMQAIQSEAQRLEV